MPPDAGPAPRRRGTLLAAAVLPVLLVLVLAGAVVPGASGRRPIGAVAAFLPAAARVDGIDTDAQVVWQAGQHLVPALRAASDLTEPVLDALGYGDDPAAPELAGQWLVVDLLPPRAPGEVQTLSFLVQPDRITLQAIETPTTWTTFAPGLPVLDAAGLAGAGGSWAGTRSVAVEGDAPVVARATATTTAAAVAGSPDCYETTIALTFADLSAQSRLSRWCRGVAAGWAGDLVGGRGVLRTDRGFAPQPAPDLRTRTSPPPPATGATMSAGFYRPVDSSDYELTRFGVSSLDMAGDVLVTARYDGRVEGWSPTSTSSGDRARRYLRWRASPGGLVLALATVGSVTVAGDGRDHVTAWSADGWQLWQSSTADVITAVLPLVGSVLVADASGTVRRLDAATGAEVWSRQLGTGLTISAADGHVAVVVESTLSVLDAATGHQLWQRRLTGLDGRDPVVAVGAGVVVTKIDSWLIARDAATGAVAWWRTVDRAAVAVSASSDQIVVVGAATTQAIAADGQLRWSTAPALTARQSGDLTALTFADRVELWDVSARLAVWRYPPGFGAPDRNLVITDRGVLLYQPGDSGSGWWDYR